MKKLETQFEPGGELIVVEASITGPRGSSGGRLVLDTGAVMTTMTPEFADLVGYSAHDGIRRTRVHTAVSTEEGYLVSVAQFTALDIVVPRFLVHVFDLGHDDIDGLIGLNFLSQLNYEIRSAERRILVECVAPATT
ncbi:MAG TPA: retropepsin-like aspartic protease [Kofleriaceae bacterium]|jgi:predicted aspartyl protease